MTTNGQTPSITEALEAFHTKFPLAIGDGFPGADALLELARTTITGATSLEDLDQQIEALFVAGAELVTTEANYHLTADDLRDVYEAF